MYALPSELGPEAVLKLCFGRLEKLVLNASGSLTSGINPALSNLGTLVVEYFFGGKGVVNGGSGVLASGNYQHCKQTDV